MGMRQNINIPRPPRWATDANRTVDPSETDKDTGHVVGTRPPARWMNDIQNASYNCHRWASGLLVGNVSTFDRAGSISQPVQAMMARNASVFAVQSDGTDIDVYYLLQGDTSWTAGTSIFFTKTIASSYLSFFKQSMINSYLSFHASSIIFG